MNPSDALSRDAVVYIAGHRGLVGGALWRHFESLGFTNLVGRSSAEVDLRERDATFDLLTTVRPDVVVDAAARVGGIMANRDFPVEFLSDNLRIQTNLMDASHAAGVERFLFLGSSCIYPKFADQPIREDSLLTGQLEPTNDAYAIAKIAGILAIQGYRREYSRGWISAMPTNLYGPGDNFDFASSHVLPAMIRRLHEAKVSGAPSVTMWGTGSPRREFLHVDDLAAACFHLLETYDDPQTINVGTGEDLTIFDLAHTVANVVGYEGDLLWDTSKPDGTPRKLLDVTRLRSLGWDPRIGLVDGIRSTYDWYRANAS